MDQLSPQDIMNRMITGYWSTQIVYVAAKLGLADLIEQGPRTAEDLAAATNTHAPSLYRLLRALASMGIFADNGQRQFEMTPLARCLLTSEPGSQRALAIMSGEEHYKAWGELMYSIETGKIAFDKLFGMPCFEFLSQNVEQAKTFDAAMVGVHGRETAAMTDAYDFATFGTLADIGGGNGSLITSVLKKHTSLKGILYDLPGVTERAKSNLAKDGLADRCQVIGGSFFESIPSGADAYLMRHIIHDWDDEKSTTILRNVHKVIKDSGRLLLIEGVISEDNSPSFGKLLDLTMLTIPGGKERTASEFRDLLKQSGFELKRIIPTAAEVSVIEAVKST